MQGKVNGNKNVGKAVINNDLCLWNLLENMWILRLKYDNSEICLFSLKHEFSFNKFYQHKC